MSSAGQLPSSNARGGFWDVILILFWLCVYLGLTWVIISYVPKLLEGDAALDVFVFLSSVITTGVLPGLLAKIIEPMPNNSKSFAIEREVVIHLVLTLLSCVLLSLWGLALCFTAMDVGHLSWYIRGPALMFIVLGLGIIIVALASQQWFVRYDAYSAKKCLPFVWPRIINAPISYARLILAVATFGIPFIRDAIKHPKLASGLYLWLNNLAGRL